MNPSKKQCQERFKVVENDFFKIIFLSVTTIYIKKVKGIHEEATEKLKKVQKECTLNHPTI